MHVLSGLGIAINEPKSGVEGSHFTAVPPLLTIVTLNNCKLFEASRICLIRVAISSYYDFPYFGSVLRPE